MLLTNKWLIRRRVAIPVSPAATPVDLKVIRRRVAMSPTKVILSSLRPKLLLLAGPAPVVR